VRKSGRLDKPLDQSWPQAVKSGLQRPRNIIDEPNTPIKNADTENRAGVLSSA
jgi:hypothetical protein